MQSLFILHFHRAGRDCRQRGWVVRSTKSTSVWRRYSGDCTNEMTYTTYNYDDGPGWPCTLDDMVACAPVVAASRLLFRSASVKRMNVSNRSGHTHGRLTLLLLPFNLRHNPLDFLQGEALPLGVRSTKEIERQEVLTVCLPNDSMTVISIFFAPVWTTSSNDLTVNLIVSARFMSSLWFFSKNSRTVLDDRPTAFALIDYSARRGPEKRGK